MQSTNSNNQLDSSSDSDDFYSGAANRFKQIKDQKFRTGQVKLIGKQDVKSSSKRRRSPSPVDIDSSDEEIFKDVNTEDVETEDEANDDEEVCHQNKHVETLDDVEDLLKISPDDDLSCHAISGKRNQSSCSIPTYENDHDEIEESDSLAFDSINDSDLNHTLDDNDKVTVKVRLYSVVHRVEITRAQHFKAILQQLAEKMGLDPNKITLECKDQHLDPYGSLKTFPIGITDIIEATVVNEVVIASTDDQIELKVRSQARNSQVVVSIRPEEPMSILMQKYADAASLDITKLVFRFDGDNLEDDDTPASLDLEGGECIDVFIKE